MALRMFSCPLSAFFNAACSRFRSVCADPPASFLRSTFRAASNAACSSSDWKSVRRAEKTRVSMRLREIAEGHDASEALKRTFSDKHDKVLSELSREPAVLASFFAAMELNTSAATARLISTHAMRPDEVTDLVKKRKAEVANKVATKKDDKGQNAG